MLLPDQHRADWDQRHTDEFYQPVQAAHHLAARDPVTVGLRLSGQAAGVALGPDTGQPRHAAARHQKAAGFQLRAALLGNGPRLARDEGFVRLGAAVQHDGIRCDLVARAELDNIVLHKVVGQHLAPPAVAQAAELLR